MTRWRWIPLYLLTAGVGLGLASFVTLGLMGKAQTQGAPSDGSLPPEFLQEIEGGLPPAETPPSDPPQSQTPPPEPPPLESVPSVPQEEASTPPVVEESQMPTQGPSQPPANPALQPGPDGYVYDPTGRRDPFRPYRTIRTERTGPVALIEPLQTYDLDQLSVVGIMWDIRSPRALVRDSDGNLHTVVKNTKLGRNNGYVATIREGELVVIETLDQDGQAVRRSQVLEVKR